MQANEFMLGVNEGFKSLYSQLMLKAQVWNRWLGPWVPKASRLCRRAHVHVVRVWHLPETELCIHLPQISGLRLRSWIGLSTPAPESYFRALALLVFGAPGFAVSRRTRSGI